MLVHLVVRAEALDPAHFNTSGYLQNALALIRGVQDNGLLLVDPDGHLSERLLDAAERLPTKHGQEIRTLLAEFCTRDKTRKRVVKVAPEQYARTPAGDSAERVRTAGAADALLGEPTAAEAAVLPLNDYMTSDTEELRRYLAVGLPEVDRLDGNGPHALTFDKLIARTTRFSKWVRFYDKQVGRLNNPRFFASIERVLRVWQSEAHFPTNDMNAELYTVESPEMTPADCHRTLLRDLIDPLKKQFNLRRFDLHLKQGPAHDFHARYLQTQNVAVLFERGFDFQTASGSIMKGVVVKLGGECLDLLKRLRDQPEYDPKDGKFKSPSQIRSTQAI